MSQFVLGRIQPLSPLPICRGSPGVTGSELSEQMPAVIVEEIRRARKRGGYLLVGPVHHQIFPWAESSKGYQWGRQSHREDANGPGRVIKGIPTGPAESSTGYQRVRQSHRRDTDGPSRVIDGGFEWVRQSHRKDTDGPG